MRTPLVSVIVASYNKVEYLRACLQNLTSSTLPRWAFEVILVNDGSTDWTRSFLERFEPDYTLRIHHQENRGRAAARNQGAAMASGELLVMLDNDCLTAPDMLATLWQGYQRRPEEMLISTVKHIAVQHVPEVLVRVGNGLREFLDEEEALRPQDSGYTLQALLPLVKEHLEDLAVGWLAAQGAAITIPRTWFKRLEGFDESFHTYGMEDFDLGFRLMLSGGRLRYVREAKLYHLDHGHDSLALLAETATSIRTFYTKHAQQVETHPFLNFLIGKTTLLEFNNQVARARGQKEVSIASLDLRCSGYDMVRYRSEQTVDISNAPVKYVYNASQDFCLELLMKKVTAEIEADASEGIEVLKRPLQGSNVLVVAPHMDDEVIGCGGLIQHYKEQGARVTVAFCTSGSGQPRKLGSTQTLLISDERIAESLKACELLGVDHIECFHLHDRQLGRSLQDAGYLRKMLSMEQFDAIYTPGPDEFHPDHQAVWRWVKACVEEVAPSLPMYCYEVWGSCRPDRVLPIDDGTWQKKLAALYAYRSQLRVMDYIKLAREISERRGALVSGVTGMVHAEAFRAVRGGTA